MPAVSHSSSATPARRARSLPDLRALEAFVAVCDCGSMALAAQRLAVSQSAVSQQVKALEEEYGLQLFDRDVRPARPTRAGRALQELAAELLGQAHALGERMRASARQDYAQIRLGCVDSFAATLGPALIRALSGAARQIQLWSGLTPTLSAQLQGRELDLAICTDSRIDDSRVSQRLLFSESWVAVFPRQHPVRALASVRELAELVGELPLIRYSQRSVIGQQVERWLRHVGVQAERRFEFDATDPLLSLVSAGLGWAVSTPLCLWQSRQYLDSVTVLPLPPARLGQRDFFLLAREGETGSLDREIARVTRDVIRRDILPAIRRAMPALPADAISCPDEEHP
ncbi:LysR family transcriptional regulator [Azohydromonas aeria]|uniref:LysR family transcriptional regulator n=1 Tax=Azohydromonas aeria TaxID=2590212 RepID=UPI0012F9CDA6|nr:LysR family transcriptional regulator [Azohydromonas aeria]